jgi:hypothetical protein
MEVRILVGDHREAVCDISTAGPMPEVVAGRVGPVVVSCVITSVIEVRPTEDEAFIATATYPPGTKKINGPRFGRWT